MTAGAATLAARSVADHTYGQTPEIAELLRVIVIGIGIGIGIGLVIVIIIVIIMIMIMIIDDATHP